VRPGTSAFRDLSRRAITGIHFKQVGIVTRRPPPTGEHDDVLPIRRPGGPPGPDGEPQFCRLAADQFTFATPVQIRDHQPHVLGRTIAANTNDYAYTDRFRYEPASDRFLLIGEDDANTQRGAAADGIRVSDNYLTGERAITIMHAARGKYVRETNTVRHIDKQKVFLEEATMQDIDFDKLMDELRDPRSAPTRRKSR
jgi:hypothetical protein